MDVKGHVVVIGSGAAGTQCARILTGAGWRVTQAENDRWGGTCLWRGCIPKKSLYHSAQVMRTLKDAEQFGVVAGGDPIVDWQTVLAWKWHAQETYAGDQEALAARHGIELARGEASFVSPGQIIVAGETLAPDHIVIATGSRPVLPPIPGIELADTSAEALRFAELPSSLVIVGGGFISMELAGVFSAFGTAVTVVTRGARVLEMLDEDLARAAFRRLESAGVRFHLGCSASLITGKPDDLNVTISTPAGTSLSIACDRLIMAVGRSPAIDGLNVEAADVELDHRGHIVLDRYLRTTNPKVWCAGDAAGGMMQTPVASCEGGAVAQSIDSGTPVCPDCTAAPITCFTVPQLATVGLTEDQARARGRDVTVSRIGLDTTGAGIIAAETDGFVKLVTDAANGKILGTQIAGSAASDMIFSAALALKAGMTGQELGSVLAVHPSFSEALAWSGG